MTAEEMFAALGYKKIKDDEDSLCYKTYDGNIYFNKITKTYEAYCDTWEVVLICPVVITIELHKAITQQMLELGWL